MTGPRGVCPYYWETGSCVRGLQCKLRHDAQTTKATGTVKPTNTSAAPSNDKSLGPFPDVQSVMIDSCDALLKPTKLIRLSDVQVALREAGESGRRISTPALAETLLIALNQTNMLHSLWVS